MNNIFPITLTTVFTDNTQMGWRCLRRLTVALALTVGGLRAEGKPPVALPETVFPALERLIEAAARQSPRMIARSAENAVAEAGREVARSGLLPSVNGNLQFNGWQRDDRSDLPRPTNAQKLLYGVSLLQPIYHWGERQNNARIGDLQLKATQGQTAEARRMLVQEIRAHFLQLVVRKTALARAQFTRDQSAQRLAQTEERVKQQASSEVEAIFSRLNFAQVELALDRAREDFESARRTLARLSGVPALTEGEVPEEIPAVAAGLDALEARLAEFNAGKLGGVTSLEILENQIEIEQLTYKNATVRLKPKLNLILGVSQDEQSYTSNIAAKSQVQSYYLGAQVNWPIFDGFATRGLVAGSLARRKQNEAIYRERTVEIREQARNQLTQVGFAARSMALTDQYLIIGENGVRGRREDAGRGLVSAADIDAAQLALFDARINAYNARLDFLLRTAEFLSTIAQDHTVVNLLPSSP